MPPRRITVEVRLGEVFILAGAEPMLALEPDAADAVAVKIIRAADFARLESPPKVELRPVCLECGEASARVMIEANNGLCPHCENEVLLP